MVSITQRLVEGFCGGDGIRALLYFKLLSQGVVRLSDDKLLCAHATHYLRPIAALALELELIADSVHTR